jgi:hypothetical protein
MRKSVAYLRLFTNGLAALRCPCSRLQVLCLPSVASPFAGASVHWTLAFSRLTRPRTTSSFDSGLSSLSLSLLRSKARGSPSVANPLAGAAIHWTVVFFRLARVPGPDARLAALRCPCSCLQARGSPSVASPFSGAIPALRTPCCAWAPARAFLGSGVRRDERLPDTRLYPARPLDLCLDPLHPARAPSGLGFGCAPPSA